MGSSRKSLMGGIAVLAVFAAMPELGLARSDDVLIAQAPAQAPAPAGKTFSKEELDQMLAPIALYPDSLLSQVMMASTYPLEVVEAARWVKANPNIKGDAAVKAVQVKSWDISVKSLVAFPQVITQMSDQLEWTQRLGDAMLAQNAEVAGSIQRLRKMAYDAENLKTNQQQKVTVEPTPAANGETQQTIIIQPSNPEQIYVPVYQPTVTYGAWPYPSYQPYYYPPYPGYGYGAAFVGGMLWGAAISNSGCCYGNWGWGSGDVDIDVDRALNVDRNFNRGDGGRWNHNPEHRKGVGYRDTASQQKFNRGQRSGADARQQFRGKDINTMASQRPAGGDRVGGGAQQRPAAGDRMGAGGQQRPGGGDRVGAGGGQQRPAGGDRMGGAGQRQGGANVQRGSGARPQNNGAFDGMNRGGQSMNRDISRGQSSINRGGGGSRGGFGGGGGGRGGGGGGRGGGGRR